MKTEETQSDISAWRVSAPSECRHWLSVEDEHFVTVCHPMTKDHHLSFLAAVADDGVQLKKLYPEGPALARFRIEGVRRVYAWCNRHGLFGVKL